jgi:hypothetical protein
VTSAGGATTTSSVGGTGNIAPPYGAPPH